MNTIRQRIKGEDITQIRKRFRHRPEWLLIQVDQMDPVTTQPLRGRLMAHHPNRDVIFKKSIGPKGLLLIEHSQKRLPEGYAVAF